MKNYLLDTHIFLWANNNPARLSNRVNEMLSNPENQLYVSAVTLWETAFLLETKPKVLKSKYPLAQFLDIALAQTRTQVLPIQSIHAQRFYEIQPASGHHDPYDRMILAQASATGFTLVSDDGRFPEYESQGLVRLLRND